MYNKENNYSETLFPLLLAPSSFPGD
uniref:Uncharacterized protein n=1 Tax=Anguilla anguilla TaxID=7936 RepID=A0A0E9V022_ANGAN